MLSNKTILLTGGTGSFGQKFTEIVLEKMSAKKLIIFSRDELKQYEMIKKFPQNKYPNIRFFLGDIRDKDRLIRALDGVDIIVHAAALKQVPSCELNPIEAIKTNIQGASNIIEAAIDRGVQSILALSTDKACNPVNLYGTTKLAAEKLFIAANSYTRFGKTRFSIVRYGNVLGSRGSVVPLFFESRKSGEIPITDNRMTRFWITLEQGVNFVLKCINEMNGGEIFIPKIPSMKIIELANAIASKSKLIQTGIRPGEKLHEVLISEDESRSAYEHKDHFVILPEFINWGPVNFSKHTSGKKCSDGFRYSSDLNTHWLNAEELTQTLKNCGLWNDVKN